ncbi:glucose 1-dehydrogenase [Acidocella sp.]|uniref:glucose 1-dehydrogenase n=1 Tax=Acidocella sp. TaxID=50710 RepID=UPI002617AFFE|nr:glucose 1-dehydrogenase [Acidocella sp.]
MTDTNSPAARLAQRPYAQTLTGHKALVTGASSGIGRATALGLARAGADVVINYIGPAAGAEEVAQEITALGRRALTIAADVAQEDAVEQMFATALREFGTLHAVVSNAGLQRDSGFTEMTLEQWNTVMAVNLTGQFLTTRAAVREFKRRGPQEDITIALGKIVCMSSVHQVIPWGGHVNYAASKGGINMMMRSIAQEVAPLHIRVNAVAPGAIRTPINHDAWATPEAYQALLKLIPNGRIGEPDDIARAVAWLLSDDSDYVTGATLYVDGGMTLYPGFATGG